jgi:phosphoribosyl 1,2-cyclic phosphate phosphodiesterase
MAKEPGLSPLKLTLLGTGTSQGVPVIGCRCPVCQSKAPHDQRLRCAALLQYEGLNILIDAGPDFRQQMLRTGIRHLDAILLTHEHNDHVIGLDDVRPFNFRSGQPMRVYALPRVVSELRKRFEYVFGEPIPGLPRLEPIPIGPGSVLEIGPLRIEAIGVQHGRLPILGFRVGPICYLTDVKSIPPSEMAKLYGLQHLVTSALHHDPHPTHMNLQEALGFVAQCAPRQAWLTHISHQMGLASAVATLLPPGVALAYDGLEIEEGTLAQR